MKKLMIAFLFSSFFLSSSSQNLVPFSDLFIRKHNLTTTDFGKLQVYVKFVNSHLYKVPVSSPSFVNIGNVKLVNSTPGVIVSSDYRPASRCKIDVDFGNNAVVTFFHNAGDNEFYTETNGICLMLFTDDIIEKTAPAPKPVTAPGKTIKN